MKKLYGVTAAMVTPFKESGEVDYDGVRQLTGMLIDKGVNCLYPCGTTGEMFRLSLEEREKIAETIIQTAAGRVTVFIHCGAMNEQDTASRTCREGGSRRCRDRDAGVLRGDRQRA